MHHVHALCIWSVTPVNLLHWWTAVWQPFCVLLCLLPLILVLSQYCQADNILHSHRSGSCWDLYPINYNVLSYLLVTVGKLNVNCLGHDPADDGNDPSNMKPSKIYIEPQGNLDPVNRVQQPSILNHICQCMHCMYDSWWQYCVTCVVMYSPNVWEKITAQ